MPEEVEVESTYSLEQLRDALCNKSGNSKLTDRFRALFYLKSIGAEFKEDQERAQTAINYIEECFSDPSELLKHEVAYVLGQTKNLQAIPVLQKVLSDLDQQVMVRHEAAEALGAIGDPVSLPVLEKYYNDPKEAVPIKETCELAIERIKWENSKLSKTEKLEPSLYESIDPAPPMPTSANDKVEKLKDALNDTSKSLFERYRAMFRLRDIGTDEAVLALASGFNDDSALFKHEIAYIFGQMCSPASVPALVDILAKTTEEPMVRHEAAEALGAIATDDVLPVLRGYLNDKDLVVKQSAIVALDMYEYENSNELDYAGNI